MVVYERRRNREIAILEVTEPILQTSAKTVLGPAAEQLVVSLAPPVQEK